MAFSKDSFLKFFLFLALLTAGAQSVQAAKTYDYLIKNAMVFDGDKLEGKRKSVAIQGDRIVKIGKLSRAKAKEVIDAEGMILTPGFIDTHTHSDFNPLVYPDLANKVQQGVTTEVVGNCGMSAAPVLGTHGGQIRGIWAREGVDIRRQVKWKTFKEYRHELETKGMMTNFVGLIGHGNLRSAVMGFSQREATLGEIDEMRTMLRDAMRDGAAGISYGLVYLPGIFANQDELTQLCQEAAKSRGLCAFHMRSEGGQVVEAVEETLAIAEKAKSRVEISHLKAAGKQNWEKIGPVFEKIEAARRKGIKVSADFYPYTASFAELGVVLPDAIYQREDRLDYFRNPLKREELLNALRTHYEARRMKWDSVMVAATPHQKYAGYEGKTLLQIAKEETKEPEQVLIEILAATRFEVSAYFFSQSDDVITAVLQKDYTSVGSDSIADGSRKPHPRAFGTFPKILREYVQDRKLLSLGLAIWKMTGAPADFFLLKERGRIKKGYFADLVLFDPAKIKDNASYEDPKAAPAGISWVFVNGQPAVREGSPTGAKTGRFLTLS